MRKGSKRRHLLVFLLVMALVTASAGVVAAGYDPERGDRIIDVTVPNDNFPLDGAMAQWSYELHQANNARIEEKSGRERNASYIWLRVNGEFVLAADPPRGLF